MVSDEPVMIGAPYSVGKVTYTPEDAPNYDAVGYAGWYGEELQGNKTANGETFVPEAITAAHQTLPLPSYVEVTALDTGRTILVRVNDRGPFANDRIIDLSRGAAEQLGVIGDGAAAVRVRRVSPPDQERVALRSHGRVAERLETPPARMASWWKRRARHWRQRLLRQLLLPLPLPPPPRQPPPGLMWCRSPPSHPAPAPKRSRNASAPGLWKATACGGCALAPIPRKTPRRPVCAPPQPRGLRMAASWLMTRDRHRAPPKRFHPI